MIDDRAVEAAKAHIRKLLAGTTLPPVLVEAFEEAVVAGIAAAAPFLTQIPDGRSVEIAHDGFAGTVQGSYVTREGKRGVVVQQHGTRVVHVYGEKWLAPPTEKNDG